MRKFIGIGIIFISFSVWLYFTPEEDFNLTQIKDTIVNSIKNISPTVAANKIDKPLITESPVGNLNYLKPKNKLDYSADSKFKMELKFTRHYIGLALPSQLEKQKYLDLISNRDFLDKLKNVLSSVTEQTFETSNEFMRLDAVDVLTDSISQSKSDNKYATQIALDLLLEYKLNLSLPDRLRKSIAADRIEIYTNLREHKPQLLSSWLKTYDNQDLKKIINFADNFYFKGASL